MKKAHGSKLLGQQNHGISFCGSPESYPLTKQRLFNDLVEGFVVCRPRNARLVDGNGLTGKPRENSAWDLKFLSPAVLTQVKTRRALTAGVPHLINPQL